MPAPTTAWGEAEEAPRLLRLGEWTFELRGDEIAHLRLAGRPVLRSIRFVARDADWNTVPSLVDEVTVAAAKVDVSLRAVGLGADLRGSLRVSADDEFRVDAEVTSHSDFPRNRIGLVVLHHASVSGAPLAVGHSDGSSTRTAFPTTISPHQPAFDVAWLGWTADGVSAELEFRGDVFEMEDQRNWTDASYKTYSTPLSLPFPVDVRVGDVVSQGLRIRARPVAGAEDSAPTPVRLIETDLVVPHLQLGASPESEGMSDFDLLIELELDRDGWREKWEAARAEAGARALDVRLVTDRPDAVGDAIAMVGRDRITRIGIFSATTHVTTAPLWDALRAAAGDRELVGGTRAHYTELNRARDVLPDDLPALTFSSTPQMHARELAQVLESIDIQALTARDAVALADGRPVHVGPITLRPRFNAVATTPDAPVDEPDPRQSAFGLAAWTIASVAAFASTGVSSLTYFERQGPRGVIAPDGSPHPAAAALDAASALSGRALVLVEGLPSGVHALAARDAGTTTVVAANLTDTTVQVRLPGADGQTSIPSFGYEVTELPGSELTAGSAPESALAEPAHDLPLRARTREVEE